MKLKRLALLAISAGITSGISTVYATQISNSTTGLPGAVFTQTFESPSYTTNTLINSAFAQVSSTTLYYDGNGGSGSCGFVNESGHCVANFALVGGTPTGTNPTFSIFFSTPQTGAAFALLSGAAGDRYVFTALNGASVVDSFTATIGDNYFNPALLTGNFYGFANEPVFNQIQVQTTGLNATGGQNSNIAVVDNVQLSAAPEPGTIALLGLGIGGFIALRRRRSA